MGEVGVKRRDVIGVCLFFFKEIICLLERVVISNDLLILVGELWLFVELMILYFYCSFVICQAHWRFTYPWSKLGYLFNIQLHFSFRWDSCFGTQILNPSVSETGKWTKVSFNAHGFGRLVADQRTMAVLFVQYCFLEVSILHISLDSNHFSTPQNNQNNPNKPFKSHVTLLKFNSKSPWKVTFQKRKRSSQPVPPFLRNC